MTLLFGVSIATLNFYVVYLLNISLITVNITSSLLQHYLLATSQIEIQQLNFRLSYNDIKLFLAIAQSLPNFDTQERREQTLKSREGGVDGRF